MVLSAFARTGARIPDASTLPHPDGAHGAIGVG
jgi:hypothetical protein